MTSVAQSKVPHVHMLVCGGEPPGARESLSIRARGEITLSANASDGDTTTIDAGGGPVVFEFDTVAFGAGSVTIAVGNAADGDLVTLIDALGVTVVFEFESAGGVAAGNIPVTVGASDVLSAANLSAAINAQQTLDITAVPTLGVVDVTQGTAGTAGNTTITETGLNISAVNFTGGEDLVAAGNGIAVLIGADAAESIANLVSAINGSGIAVTAVLDAVSGDDDALLEHIGGGSVANIAILESTAGARIVVSGLSGGTDTRAGIIERVGDSVAANPMMGMIENDSEVQAMTLTIQDSPDNLRAGFDAGGNATFRVNGADVTSLVVQPKGRILFIIEGFAGIGNLDKFLRFSMSPEGSTSGTITLAYWHGDVVRRDREDDAPTNP